MPEMALQKECLYVRSTANTTGNPQLSGSAPGPLPGCHPHPGPHPGPLQPRGAAAQWCKQHLEELGATGVYIDDALNVIFPYGVEEGANDLCAILGHTDVVFPDTEPLPSMRKTAASTRPASVTTPPTPSLSWRWRPWPSTSNSNRKPASSLCSIPARRDWATSRVCAADAGL